jgi:hypothetical protein
MLSGDAEAVSRCSKKVEPFGSAGFPSFLNFSLRPFRATARCGKWPAGAFFPGRRDRLRIDFPIFVRYITDRSVINFIR